MSVSQERVFKAMSGWPMLVVTLITLPAALFLFITGIAHESAVPCIAGVVLFVGFILELCGFMVLTPNQSGVLVLFGEYIGTVKQSGFFWVNPFYGKKKVSLRLRNLNMERLKVNDQIGNPIEIAAVIVWRVRDTFAATFEVDDYIDYVEVQSESALRHLATRFPYDDFEESHKITLRGNIDEVSEALEGELRDRLSPAGVEILEARLSHLAYAQEIAEAMLRRQQAVAIVAARQKIVEGAVGMVEMALDGLSKQGIVELDEERKAAMVSNLLVVLCGDHNAQPVVNAGSLYT